MPKVFKLKKSEEEVIEHYSKHINNSKNIGDENKYCYLLGRLCYFLKEYLYWKFYEYRNIIAFSDYCINKEDLKLKFYVIHRGIDKYIGAVNISVEGNKMQYEFDYLYEAEPSKSPFRYKNYTSLAKTMGKFLKKIKEGEYKYE